jgi:hypothetical protein
MIEANGTSDDLRKLPTDLDQRIDDGRNVDPFL